MDGKKKISKKSSLFSDVVFGILLGIATIAFDIFIVYEYFYSITGYSGIVLWFFFIIVPLGIPLICSYLIFERWNSRVAGVAIMVSIAVILGLLLFSGCGGSCPASSSTVCVAGSGYYCSSVVYSHGSGNLALMVGQNTGTNWSNAIIIFAIQGNNISSTRGPIVPAIQTDTIDGGLALGQPVTVTFNSIVSNPALGTTITGTIWACYTNSAGIITYDPATGICTAGTGTVNYTQLAIVTAKAV
jgi:hypothetical protein